MSTNLLPFTKNYPKCGKLLSYSCSRTLKSSLQSNTRCRSCINKSRENAYTAEEIAFLTNNYPKLGGKYCAQVLNRSVASILVKSQKLGLSFLPFPVQNPTDNKVCCKCHQEMSKTYFGRSSHTKDKLNKCCKPCLKRYRSSRDVLLKKYQYDQKYREYKKQTDPIYNLKKRLRSSFKTVFNNKKIRKNYHVLDLLGCSLDFFIKHIESQFDQHMTWENKGFYGWHIDHIIPCSTFDFTKEEDLKKCWHYTNLRPLWGTTEIAKQYGYDETYIGNLNKGDRLIIDSCDFQSLNAEKSQSPKM